MNGTAQREYKNIIFRVIEAVWYAKTEHNEILTNSKGDTNLVLSFIMIKPYKPQPNVDGMKPIAQAIQPVQGATSTTNNN